MTGTSAPSIASGARPSQSGSTWLAGSLRCPLAKKHDVGHHGGSFPLEGIGGQTDRPDEIGLGRQVLADGGILFIEGVMGRDEGQHAAGL